MEWRGVGGREYGFVAILTNEWERYPKPIPVSLRDTPARKLGKALSIMTVRQNNERSSFSLKKTANHKTSLYTLMAQSPKTSQGGASLSSKVRLPSMKTVQPIRSQPPA